MVCRKSVSSPPRISCRRHVGDDGAAGLIALLQTAQGLGGERGQGGAGLLPRAAQCSRGSAEGVVEGAREIILIQQVALPLLCFAAPRALSHGQRNPVPRRIWRSGLIEEDAVAVCAGPCPAGLHRASLAMPEARAGGHQSRTAPVEGLAPADGPHRPFPLPGVRLG